MMKILLVSDIHQNTDVVKTIHDLEEPDLVLDCGDHSNLKNMVGLTPHYYVEGNHEPRKAYVNLIDGQLPIPMLPGQIIDFTKKKERIKVLGIGGNYSTKSKSSEEERNKRVTLEDLSELEKVPERSIDIILAHQSPKSLEDNLSQQILDQIERIRPKYVFSGHFNIPNQEKRDETWWVNLPDVCRGYGLLNIDGQDYQFEAKTMVFGRGGKPEAD